MVQGYDPYAGQRMGLGNLGNLSQVMYDASNSPIQNQGVPGSQLSVAQVLGKLAQAYAGNKIAENQLAKQNELGQRIQGDTNEGMNSILAGMKSDDPISALIAARSHPSPVVRDVAKEQLKGFMTPKDLAGMATGDSVLANPNNPSQFKAKQNLQSLTPGAPVVNDAGIMVDPSIGAQPNAVPQVSKNSNGDIIQTSPTGMKLINDAPRISNTTTVNNIPGQVGETEFEKAFGKEQGKMLSNHINDRNASVNALDSISEAKDLLKGGIHAGALADLTKGVDKASIAIFGTDPGKAARTERFQSVIGDIVLGRTKELTGVISNSDREYLEAVSAGKISLEPTAMKGILDRIDKGMRKKIQTTDQSIQAFKNREKGLPTIDAGVQRELPATQSGGNDLDSFLKSKGF